MSSGRLFQRAKAVLIAAMLLGAPAQAQERAYPADAPVAGTR